MKFSEKSAGWSGVLVYFLFVYFTSIGIGVRWFAISSLLSTMFAGAGLGWQIARDQDDVER